MLFTHEYKWRYTYKTIARHFSSPFFLNLTEHILYVLVQTGHFAYS